MMHVSYPTAFLKSYLLSKQQGGLANLMYNINASVFAGR